MTFNINGIRARLHQLAALRETYNPDLIGLQETKVDDPQFPVEAVASLGYYLAWFGQKGHYGVALLSRFPLQDITKGLPGDAADAQRRLISTALPLTDGRSCA